MKILIIIPAFNEEGSIMDIIENIDSFYPSADKLVINDSSTDNTRNILKQNSVAFLDLPVNLGIGGGFRQDIYMRMKIITILPFKWMETDNTARMNWKK